jgi:hypothetical protein
MKDDKGTIGPGRVELAPSINKVGGRLHLRPVIGERRAETIRPFIWWRIERRPGADGNPIRLPGQVEVLTKDVKRTAVTL